MNIQRSVSIAGTEVALSLEVTNLFNQKNAVIVNPVTGKAYPDVAPGTDFTALRDNRDYDVSAGTRDPRYDDPNSSGLPPFNPARYMAQRHIMLGASFRF
jgi:hypothetical protein